MVYLKYHYEFINGCLGYSLPWLGDFHGKFPMTAASLRVARGQRTDIKVVADGPSHAPTFKAMLSFQAWKLGTH
jgi:hypothetical protein